jgi:hypothetical protein
MQYLRNPESETKINIFKHVEPPLSFALTCRIWSITARRPYDIVRYRKVHALFNAVRLDPTFIDISVCQTLNARNIVVSRCFIQKLLAHSGKYDQRLIKFTRDVGHYDADGIRDCQQSLWKTSNLPIQLCNAAKPSKNSNSAGFKHVINHVPAGMQKRILKDAILNKRFAPFPLRSKALHQNDPPHVGSVSLQHPRQGSFLK